MLQYLKIYIRQKHWYKYYTLIIKRYILYIHYIYRACCVNYIFLLLKKYIIQIGSSSFTSCPTLVAALLRDAAYFGSRLSIRSDGNCYHSDPRCLSSIKKLQIMGCLGSSCIWLRRWYHFHYQCKFILYIGEIANISFL